LGTVVRRTNPKMAMRRRRKGTAPNRMLKAMPPARKKTSSWPDLW
jgi:hypothetical protein